MGGVPFNNCRHNITERFKTLLLIWFVLSKAVLDIYELPHELAHDLRFRVLDNKEIFLKYLKMRGDRA